MNNDLMAMYFAQAPHQLPGAYRRVRYLTNTGMGSAITINQTLDWSKTVTIRTTAKCPQLNKRMCLLGNYQGSTHGETLNIEINASANWRIYHASGYDIIVDYTLSVDTVYVFESMFTPSTGSVHRIYAVDGTLLIEASGFAMSGTTTRFYMFRDGRQNMFYPLSIYHIEIYHDDTKTSDFIPVLRQVDYKPGMYDLCRNGISSQTKTSFWVKGTVGDEFTWGEIQ